MITWMQRHKKYLIITIWISTIAFVGAGFVGWGQYSYGDKAGAIAKVGDIEITKGELQKTYSSLYGRYNQIFKGNFDEEKAKSFGLKAQALKQLTDQALLLNLALSYDLTVNDSELIDSLKTKKYFFKNGVFDKDTYKQVLSNNNLTLKEYEAELRKELLIAKVLKLLPVDTTKNENSILNTINNIADKIEYKILDNSQIEIDTSDSLIKAFWENTKQNYMTEKSYDVEYIEQKKITQNYDESKIISHYNDNKNHFKGEDGKILSLKDARVEVIDELNKKATKDTAIRTYISYKKNKLNSDIKFKKIQLSLANNKFNTVTLDKISKLSLTKPYMKPIEVNGKYFIFKLLKINNPKIKTFKEAKNSLLKTFIYEQKKSKLLKLAKDSIKTFNGQKSDFITNHSALKLKGLNVEEANQFLIQLFSSQKKRDFITISDSKIVLYNILEQKLLKQKDDSKINNNSISKIKNNMFNNGLLKNLQTKYKTEIFIKGL